MSNGKSQRRPTTQTLKRVYDWLRSQNLYVYGPAVDFDKGVQYTGQMDYDVPAMIRLEKLRKKHPQGLPEQEYPE
jgi:hypothetical protein